MPLLILLGCGLEEAAIADLETNESLTDIELTADEGNSVTSGSWTFTAKRGDEECMGSFSLSKGFGSETSFRSVLCRPPAGLLIEPPSEPVHPDGG